MAISNGGIVAFLKAMQPAVYRNHLARGWEDKPRSDSCHACLFVSEISEGMEGFRKLLKDDKLEQYDMLPVELADLTIRIMNYLASKGVTWDLHDEKRPYEMHPDETYNLAFLQWHISQWWYETEVRGGSNCHHIKRAAVLAMRMGIEMGYPMFEILRAKVAFNMSRPDHDPEVRNNGEEGSKRF